MSIRHVAAVALFALAISGSLITPQSVSAQGGFVRSDGFNMHAAHSVHFRNINDFANLTPYVDDNADFRTFTLSARPGMHAGVHLGVELWVGEIDVDMNNDGNYELIATNVTQDATCTYTFPEPAGPRDQRTIHVHLRFMDVRGAMTTTTKDFNCPINVYAAPRVYVDPAGNSLTQVSNEDAGSKIPIVVVEGFDPLNTTFPEFYYTLFYDEYNTVLHSAGYTAFLLNFNDAGQHLRDNAQVVSSALDAVRALCPNKNKIAIFGLSMGGVITRYALAKDEGLGITHDVGLYVSCDSPQKGAHAGQSLADNIRALSQELPGNPVVVGLQASLQSPSAIDMLDYDPYDETGLASAQFYGEINALNGGTGYPHTCYNTAVSNGAMQATWGPSYLSQGLGNLNILSQHGSVLFTVPISSNPRDVGPGSMQTDYSALNQFGVLLALPLGFGPWWADFYYSVVFNYNPVFIPTWSALDLTGYHFAIEGNEATDLVNAGTTPFDETLTQSTASFHAVISAASDTAIVHWLHHTSQMTVSYTLPGGPAVPNDVFTVGIVTATPVTIQPKTVTIGGVVACYVFDHWDDGSVENPRSFASGRNSSRGVVMKPLPPGDGTPAKIGAGVVNSVASTPDGTGGSYLCWSDLSNGTDSDILVAHLNSSGALLAGWPVNVTPAKPGDQLNPVLVGDGAGGVYVGWQDGSVTGAVNVIRLTSNATTVTGWGAAAPTFGGIVVRGSSCKNPVVARASDASLLVAWNDSRTPNGLVYAQKVSAGGAALWASGGVQVSETSNETVRPSIVSDGIGGAYVAYANAAFLQAYVQRLQSANGARVLTLSQSEVAELTSNTDNYAPVLASDGATGVFVAYMQLVGAYPYTSDIAVVHVDDVNFTNYWTLTVCSATGDQFAPSIVADGSGGAVLSWVDQRVAGTYALYAARVVAGGALASGWPVNGLQIASSLRWFGERPASSADGAGGATFAWAVQPGDIFSRGASACGGLSTTVSVCTEGNEQNQPCIAATGIGAATVAWRDARFSGTNTGVFAASVVTPNLTAPSLGVANGTFMQALTWTGPASDPIYGAPVSFDVRKSSAAINASNWDSASPVANVAANGPPGTAYCVPVTGLSSCHTYYYALRATYSNCSVLSSPLASSSGKTKCFGDIQIDCGSGLVYQSGTDAPASPTVLEFSQPRPNPARDGARFDLAIPGGHEGEDVRFAIYDLLGRRVREVIHEPARVGRQTIEWRLDDESGVKVSRGMYYARLQIGAQTFTHTVIVQR